MKNGAGCVRCQTPSFCGVFGCSPGSQPSEAINSDQDTNRLSIRMREAISNYGFSVRNSLNEAEITYQWSRLVCAVLDLENKNKELKKALDEIKSSKEPQQ